MQEDPRSTRSLPKTTEERPPPRRTVRGQEAFAVVDAVGSEPRWAILSVLSEGPKTMEELTDSLGKSKGTISTHVSRLEDVDIVTAEYNITDAGGIEKRISLSTTRVLLDIEGGPGVD